MLIITIYALIGYDASVCHGWDMKRLIIAIILLLIAAGTIFFIGWVQLHIKDGQSVVIFTKTKGWESKPVYPGEFVWRWEAVFPTLLKRYHFSDIRETLTISQSANLRNAQLYRSYLPSSPQFSYTVEATLHYRVRPASLPNLAKNDGLRPDTQAEYLRTLSSSIQSVFVQYIPELMASLPVEATLSQSISQLQTDMIALVQREFPQIEVSALNLSRVELADTELYQIAKEQYYAVLDAENVVRQLVRPEISRAQLLNQLRGENLKEVALLLDAHPGLLEYLKLAVESNNDLLGIASFFGDNLGIDEIPSNSLSQ